MKILLTNWINLLGVFIAVFLYSVIYNIYDTTVLRNIFQSVFAAFILVFLYGIIFWLIYICALIAFDLLFIVKDQNNLKLKLLIEWLLVSVPFIYWALKYNQYIFLFGMIGFLITQLIRQNLILKLIH